MKFHSYWSIRTARGWSCLLLPRLNRPDPVVHIFAGVVDTDTYTAPINFPFVAAAVRRSRVTTRPSMRRPS
jgi:hypothetical protein